MGRMLYRRNDTPANVQRVFLAVAAYEGLSAGFTYALFHTAQALQAAGIESELAIYSGNCNVDDSRNRLVRDFLQSRCTDLVFLDSDLGWYARDFVSLVQYDRDVVAGIYPKKHGDDGYPVILMPGPLMIERSDGLMEVQCVPTGFLRIKRHVLEALAAKSEWFNSKNDADSAIPCIFDREIHNGERWGGDYVFSRKWRALGGKIHIDPQMRFEHSGEHTWHGCVGSWLRQKHGVGLFDGLQAIREGRETVEQLVELFDAYANPYAATPPLMAALAMTARNAKGPVLECGAGLSSLVLAAATKHAVHTLEDNPVFADHVRREAERHGLTNLVVHCGVPQGGWYNTSTLPALDWSLVFIDGPRRAGGSRLTVFDKIDLRNAAVIADDAGGENNISGLKSHLDRTHNTVIIDRFVVGAPKPSLAVAAE